MGRFQSYIHSASQLISAYTGAENFPSFARKYFAAHKKFGSRDRKWISHLCYSFFRMGKAAMELPAEERILSGLFLCSNSPNELLAEVKPGWIDLLASPIEEKMQFLNKLYGPIYYLEKVFPWIYECSPDLKATVFIKSHFVQPKLFIRTRPGQHEAVLKKLRAGGIDFLQHGEDCIALTNSTKIEDIIDIDREAVIQDLSSQRTGELMQMPVHDRHPKVWDCCAASGGKSILAFDRLGEMELTVSDIRRSILVNLRKRFEKAGIRPFKILELNLADPDVRLPREEYDLVIADVPCTGSGTWSRTPEQLYYFNEQKILEFSALQRHICRNIVNAIKPGGRLLYITCSVFRKENEEAVQFLERGSGLKLIRDQLIQGHHEQADTLFAALLER